MLRFANTQSKDENGKWKEGIRFLQTEAGKTISAAISQSYFKTSGQPDEDEISSFIDSIPADFFTGIGKYLGGRDRQASIRFTEKKFQRMIEKMREEQEEYCFDAFEEYLFYEMLCQLRNLINDLPELRANYLGQCWVRQKKVAGQLVELYSYQEREAKRMAQKVCRPDKMLPDRDSFNKDSLFFADMDFILIFSNGFVEGIRQLADPGNFTAYDYDSACEIFTDAGCTVPLKLVGTGAAM